MSLTQSCNRRVVHFHDAVFEDGPPKPNNIMNYAVRLIEKESIHHCMIVDVREREGLPSADP